MTALYLLTFLVCFCYALMMLLYFIGWHKTPVSNPSPALPALSTRISIILPVRNEEENILSALECLSGQSYARDKFEIIVADDHSSDKTCELILQSRILNLKLIRLTNGEGKKKAIAAGIAQSAGSLIVTTDADCSMGKNWLSAIVSFYEEHKPKMIVAPVLSSPQSSSSATFHQLFQSQETTMLTASACGSLYYNHPILCSGANLAYEKDAFLAVNGFEGIDKTATGDDIFLMLKFYQKFRKKIRYIKSNDAVVFTRPEKRLHAAFLQRKRWASKSFSYGLSHITWAAALVYFANFFILLAGILSAINIKFVPAFISSLSIKLLIDFMLLYSATSFFRKKFSFFVFVLASLVYPLYVSVTGLVSPFGNYSWKGRHL